MGIFFGIGIYYKLYLGLGNITEKDQLTRFSLGENAIHRLVFYCFLE